MESAEIRLNAIFKTLSEQRNAALDSVARLSGEVAVRDAHISELNEALSCAMKAQEEQRSAKVIPIEGEHAA